MASKIKKHRRVLRSGATGKVVSKAQPSPVKEYSSASMRIMALPGFSKILVQLQKGVSIAKIVTWIDREGWLGTMSPSTATQYLYKFKSECPELIERKPDESETYDFFVGSSIPEVDTMAEIDKLIMAQKRRVSLEMKTEVSMGKLFNTTHKEVDVLGKLLAIRGQMEGRGVSVEGAASNGDTASTLRNLRIDEGERDRMQELVGNLIRDAKHANKKSKNNQKTSA